MPRGWILHVDLDQFVAAVEVRRHPELRGLPVVVGGEGDPTAARQVVMTATYEAREYGVHSGMPIRNAARRCPDCVFLPADREAYEAASVEVMDVLRTFPVVVEVWGWDEAYLGARTDDPETLAHQLRDAVLQTTGLSCSIGIGDNKLLAKTAVGFVKPAGVGRLTQDQWLPVMGDKPTDAVSGIGAKTAQKLAAMGIRTVAELAVADEQALADRFGPTIGPWVLRMGQGRGDTTVSSAPWVARSRSKETTYPSDLVDPVEVQQHVGELARDVTHEVVADGRRVVRVAVKVRTRTFFTQTKIRKLAEPTTDPEVVAATALALLDAFETDRPIRLLGVRVELEPLSPDG